MGPNALAADEFCEGHSAAGWGIGGSVWLQTAGYEVRSFGQWAVANCAAPPSVIASQYEHFSCKLLLVRVSL